jgi:hypothetical protein
MAGAAVALYSIHDVVLDFDVQVLEAPELAGPQKQQHTPWN